MSRENSNFGNFGSGYNFSFNPPSNGTFGFKSGTGSNLNEKFIGGSVNNNIPDFTYKRECFGSGSFINNKTGSQYPANSGRPGFGLFNNTTTKNFGQTPDGLYEAKNCRVEKREIIIPQNPFVPVPPQKHTMEFKKCDLKPIDHNANGRTYLQVHSKSSVAIKGALNLDSQGCIATGGVKEVKDGDKILVEK